MAKDPTTGPVSDPEGGTYESSEEIRSEDLTRSEIINAFGETLGKSLIEAGYSSFSSMIDVTDEDLLAITGIGPATVAKIRKKLSATLVTAEMEITVEEEDAGPEETTEEVDAEVESDAEAVAPEPEDVPGEEEAEAPDPEVLPEESAEGIDYGPSPDDHDMPPGTFDEPPAAPPPPPPLVEEPAMSVRVRRAMESAAEYEEKRKADEKIREANQPPDFNTDLGHVGVDFVPEEDE